MFGTSKLCVLPKRCDAKRNRCCFNLEPDLSKLEYITFSIHISPPTRTVFLQCCCILGALFTADGNVSCQALHKRTGKVQHSSLLFWQVKKKDVPPTIYLYSYQMRWIFLTHLRCLTMAGGTVRLHCHPSPLGRGGLLGMRVLVFMFFLCHGDGAVVQSAPTGPLCVAFCSISSRTAARRWIYDARERKWPASVIGCVPHHERP